MSGVLICLGMSGPAQAEGMSPRGAGSARAIKSDQKLIINNDVWVSQSASKPFSLIVTRNAYRFEVHRGDHASFDPPEGKERSELASFNSRILPGKKFTAEFDLMVEPGPPSDRNWFAAFQVHPDDIPGHVASPLFAIEIEAAPDNTHEDLLVVGETSPEKPPNAWAYRRVFARTPFTRGAFHHITVELIDNNGADRAPFDPPFTPAQGHFGFQGNFGQGDGLCRVTYDRALIADYKNIPMGYGFAAGGRGSYPKFGIYAGSAKQPADKGLVVWIASPVMKFTR